ncbi:MAG: WGR domain-containing protein [Methylocella sp.]
MRGFYRLDVQPDLFGQWCFIREWGRIGRAGQVRMIFPIPWQRRRTRPLPCNSAARSGGAIASDKNAYSGSSASRFATCWTFRPLLGEKVQIRGKLKTTY